MDKTAVFVPSPETITPCGTAESTTSYCLLQTRTAGTCTVRKTRQYKTQYSGRTTQEKTPRGKSWNEKKQEAEREREGTWRETYRPTLPSITMVNVSSLNNKMEELESLVMSQKV